MALSYCRSFALEISEHIIEKMHPRMTARSRSVSRRDASDGSRQLICPTRQVMPSVTCEITQCKEQSASFHVIFAVDTSGSMAGAPILEAMKGIRACLPDISSRDVATLLFFSDKVTCVESCASAYVIGQRIAVAPECSGQTALYDAIQEAVKHASAYSFRHRYCVTEVIVLTDGLDNKSTQLPDDVVQSVRKPGTAHFHMTILMAGMQPSEQRTLQERFNGIKHVHLRPVEKAGLCDAFRKIFVAHRERVTISAAVAGTLNIENSSCLMTNFLSFSLFLISRTGAGRRPAAIQARHDMIQELGEPTDREQERIPVHRPARGRSSTPSRARERGRSPAAAPRRADFEVPSLHASASRFAAAGAEEFDSAARRPQAAPYTYQYAQPVVLRSSAMTSPAVLPVAGSASLLRGGGVPTATRPTSSTFTRHTSEMTDGTALLDAYV